MALFSEDEKYGYINTKGEVVVEPQYKLASRFSEGLAGVRDAESDLCGFINKKGKLVIECLYTEANLFKDGYARVSVQGSIGYINKKGEFVLRTSLKADEFSEGYARYTNDEKLFGFINMSGKEVIECKYSFAGPFSNERALVYTTDEKVGYIDTNGNYAVEPMYELFYSEGTGAGFSFSSDGYVIVLKGEKFGVVDKNGKVILDCIYEGLDGNLVVVSPIG